MRRRSPAIAGGVLALAALVWAQEPPAPAPAPAAPAKPAEKPRVLALVGGDVHTITGGLLRRATVVATNGRITAVGGAVRVPDGAETVDCTGKQVCPGLVSIASFGVGVAGGRGSVADRCDPWDPAMDLVLAGGVTALHIASFGEGGGGVLGPETAVIHLAKGDLADMLVREPATQIVRWPAASAADRAAAREALDLARDYLRKVADAEAAKAKGQKVEDPKPDGKARPWIPFLKDRRVARIPARDAGDLLSACDFAERYGLRVTFEGAAEAWVVADRVARAGAAVIVIPRSVDDADPDLARGSGGHPRQAAVLRAAGVTVAVGPDSAGISIDGIGGRDLTSLAVDAAFAIRGGLSDADALRAVTLDAARACGVEDRLGSVEVGKDADLLVLSGPPLDYRTVVEKTIVAGKVRYDVSKLPALPPLPAAKR